MPGASLVPRPPRRPGDEASQVLIQKYSMGWLNRWLPVLYYTEQWGVVGKQSVLYKQAHVRGVWLSTAFIHPPPPRSAPVCCVWCHTSVGLHAARQGRTRYMYGHHKQSIVGPLDLP